MWGTTKNRVVLKNDLRIAVVQLVKAISSKKIDTNHRVFRAFTASILRLFTFTKEAPKNQHRIKREPTTFYVGRWGGRQKNKLNGVLYISIICE